MDRESHSTGFSRARAWLGRLRRRLAAGPAPAPPGAAEPAYQFPGDGREVAVGTPEPPYPFQNVLYNNVYYTSIDQCARGLGRHLTPDGWANNLVENERHLYVRDDEDGQFFLLDVAPVYKPFERFRCTHGLNYSLIEQRALGLEALWRLWVPAGEDPVEIWDVRLRDLAGRPRRLSLFAHVAMKCDGTDLFVGELCRIAQWVPDIESLFVRMDAERHTQIDFPRHNGFLTSRPAAAGWDANPGAFLGYRGTPAAPRAVATGRCENSRMAMWPPIAALHVRLELPAAGAAPARFLLGACAHEPDIARLRAVYLAGTLEADPVFDTMRAEQARITGNLHLETPEPQINRMLNTWVKKQIHHGAVWGRWGYKGYRDGLQHAAAVAALDGAQARRNILDACAHQYADGFALHGWRPLSTRRYADGGQWLVHATTEYLKETGDFGLLDEAAPYYDGGAGPLREHLDRAMNRLWSDRGPHGLCLAWGGDWNDSLTGVCRRGRGESVWLSMAFCRAALLMAELADALKAPDDAARMRAWHGVMKEAINTHAWDGEWYLCALDDDGNPLGSARNEEGRIFLIAQAWAVLGGVADDARWARAWAAVNKHLIVAQASSLHGEQAGSLRYDAGGGFRLVWPSYTRFVPAAGRISTIRPGTAENGSVYTHGNAFMLAALLERGLADEALALWRAIVPGNPARPPCQPNVFFSGYYGPDSEVQPGLADHPWMTGSASWMFLAVTELLLGARRTYRGLVLRPCLPGGWERASLTRTYRGTTYEIKIDNPGARAAAPVARIAIDGREHPKDDPLPIDGERHEVIVTMDGSVGTAGSVGSVR